MKHELDVQHQRHLAHLEESKKYIKPDQSQPQQQEPPNNMQLGDEDNAEQNYGWWYGVGKTKKPKSSKGLPNTPLPWLYENPDQKGLIRPLGASDNATEMVKWYTGKRKDWWDKYQP